MDRDLDASDVPALSLLASLVIRDLDEISRGEIRVDQLGPADIRRRRLRSLREVFASAERGAEPVYEQIGERGGSLLESNQLHSRVASLDQDLGLFTLISRLRPDEEPEQIKDWAHELAHAVHELDKVGWARLAAAARERIIGQLRPFLLQLERLDEQFPESGTAGDRLLP